jgi:hypothetical protein
VRLLRTGRGTRSRWFLPLFSVGLGVVTLAAAWIGDQYVTGVTGLGVMVGFGLLILLTGRSETVRGLRGDGRDERFARSTGGPPPPPGWC